MQSDKHIKSKRLPEEEKTSTEASLISAIIKGDITAVARLIDEGVNVNARVRNYESALYEASFSGEAEIVRILLDRGADINAQGGYYGTALQAALASGRGEIVQILLDRGADINAQGGYYGTALSAASAHGRTQVVQILLSKGADVDASVGEFNDDVKAASVKGHDELLLNWDVQGQPSLKADLEELGLESPEIDQLIADENSQDPWIYPNPAPISGLRLPDPSHHLYRCVHSTPYPYNVPDDRTRAEAVITGYTQSHTNWTEQSHQRSSVEQLCGLAGIIPFSRRKTVWNGTALLSQINLLPTDPALSSSEDAWKVDISYHMSGQVLGSHETNMAYLSRASEALAAACYASGFLQSVNLCCQSMTILCWSEKMGKDTTELCNMSFHDMLALYEMIQKAVYEMQVSTESDGVLQDSYSAAVQVLQMVDPSIRFQLAAGDFEHQRHQINIICLAVQTISLAVLSYTQAHTGALEPFFITVPVSMVTLRGIDLAEDSSNRGVEVHLTLRELSCLGNMLQRRKVLVFEMSQGTRESVGTHGDPSPSQRALDMVAAVPDLLDTWGPGGFIWDNRISEPVALFVGGGYIFKTLASEKMFHWDLNKPDILPQGMLESWGKVRIGALVTINEACMMDVETLRPGSAAINIGTQDPYWETSAYTIGITGSQFTTVVANRTVSKVKGRTLKHTILEFIKGDDILEWLHYLEWPVAVQVSLCTGVSRRVPLRELVADVLPILARNISANERDNLISELRSSADIFDIFLRRQQSEDELCKRIANLIRMILGRFASTGIQSANSDLMVGWPCTEDYGAGVSIRCTKDNIWVKALEDSTLGASFVYATTKCLVSSGVVCTDGQEACRALAKCLGTRMISVTLYDHPHSTGDTFEEGNTYYLIGLKSVTALRPRRTSGNALYLVASSNMLGPSATKRLIALLQNSRFRVVREATRPTETTTNVVIMAGKYASLLC